MAWWRAPRWHRVSATVALLVLAATLGIIGAVLNTKGTKDAAEIAEIIGGVLALLALVPPLVRQWRRAGQALAPTATSLESAKKTLAGLIEEQWRFEAIIRSLDDPNPIPVKWRLIEHDSLIDRSQNISSGVLAFSGQSDQITEMADAFRQLKRRRLVILGGPGMGKTTLAVQLVLELLRSREDNEPIPVLLTVNNWDTVAYPKLQDWLAIRLGQDYPALRAEEGGDSIPQSLAARAHILPVLDGLDELPDAARTEVISKLNLSLGADDQLILTSRTSEYAAAVEARGSVLRSAAVIEPEPLTRDAVASYLENCLPPRTDSKWLKTLADIRDGKASALADVTATPLGIWLLRTVYFTTGRSPESLRRGNLRTPHALRKHLFSELIPALISSRAPANRPAEVYKPKREWNPEHVSRWLGFYAWNFNDVNTKIAPNTIREFTWWNQAGLTMPPFAIGICAGLVGFCGGLVYGGAIGLSGGLARGVKTGFYTALFFGPAMGLVLAVMIGASAAVKWIYETPGYADLHIKRKGSVRKQHSRQKGFEQRILSPLGIAFGIALTAGVLAGIVAGVASGLEASLITGLVAWMGLWLLRWAETPAATDRAATPTSSWRADRLLVWLRALVTTIVFGFALGFPTWLLVGPHQNGLADTLTSVLAGAGVGFSAGILIGNHHASFLFTIANLRLALLGNWSPLGLMLFLDDCHRLGLLRAVGPTYQFRHAELQDYLAANFSQHFYRGIASNEEIRPTTRTNKPGA